MLARTTAVKGLLWDAEVDVVQLVDPRNHWAWRALFVQTHEFTRSGEKLKLQSPGTMVLLCRARSVTIQPSSAVGKYSWTRDRNDLEGLTSASLAADDLDPWSATA